MLNDNECERAQWEATHLLARYVQQTGTGQEPEFRDEVMSVHEHVGKHERRMCVVVCVALCVCIYICTYACMCVNSKRSG